MKRIFSILVLLIVTQGLFAAITFSDKAGNGAATVTTLTIPLTNNASGNTMITCVTQAKDAANRTVTNVTYGGVAMTKAVSQDDSTLQDATSIWFLLNPATGSNNVVVTANGTASTLSAEGATWAGVKQSGQPDSTNLMIFATTTTPSITNTTVASGCIMQDNLLKTLTTGSVTPGSGQTTINNASVAAYWAASTYALGVPVGTNIFTYSFSLTSSGQLTVAAFAPAPAASTTNSGSVLPCMGVGN